MNCIALRMLYSIGDSISMLPISDYAWTEQQFRQLFSTFAYVHFKALEASKTNKEERRKESNKKNRTNTDTVCKESIQQIIKYM